VLLLKVKLQTGVVAYGQITDGCCCLRSNYRRTTAL